MAGFVSAATVGAVTDPRLDDEADFIGTSDDAVYPEHHAGHEHHGKGEDDAKPKHHHNIDTGNDKHRVLFEVYHHYATIAREVEKTFVAESIFQQIRRVAFFRRKNEGQHVVGVNPAEGHSSGDENVAPTEKEKADLPPSYVPRDAAVTDNYGVTEEEWETAQRATRTASWAAVFYLITTDILGPFSVPWSIAQLGYGPGVILYTVLAGMACYSGVQLWQQFCGLDSPRYPLRNYGDLGYRLIGNWARVLFNFLQSCQFFLGVCLLIVSNGQGLAQMAAGKSGNGSLCFVVAEVIFLVLGFLLGQIRTLARLGWLANLAVWLNVFVIFMTMGVCAVYPPNYQAVLASNSNIMPNQPIVTSAWWPANTTVSNQVTGVMNGVYSYGGATLFNELMAEMRRPADFWKALIIADVFIYVVYIVLGLVVYSEQGQYTYEIAYQGISNSAYAWQTVGNAISLVSGVVAALLYGNIGIKVFYAAVLRDAFGFPPLESKTGKITWFVFIPIYWSLAFVIAAAVPQINNLAAFVASAFILQFSYTFPPILMIIYNCQRDSMLPEEVFDPATATVQRVDTGWRRWSRGYFKRPMWNSANFIYFLAGLATCGLGLWASIESMIAQFAASSIEPFSCNSPTG